MNLIHNVSSFYNVDMLRFQYIEIEGVQHLKINELIQPNLSPNYWAMRNETNIQVNI